MLIQAPVWYHNIQISLGLLCILYRNVVYCYILYCIIHQIIDIVNVSGYKKRSMHTEALLVSDILHCVTFHNTYSKYCILIKRCYKRPQTLIKASSHVTFQQFVGYDAERAAQTRGQRIVIVIY